MSEFTNRRIQVGLGRTVNLGNYESGRADVWLEADIQDDGDQEMAIRALSEEANDNLNSILRERKW
jgi:hypothetical protein